MDKNKKWSRSVILITITILILIGIFVAVIDPFFHFHKPLNGLAYPINNQAYQNPGIVKNFEYDSIITGSSMTENFKTSWFKELMGLNVVKVSYSGAYSKNLSIISSLALNQDKDIKKVFLGLDIFVLEGEAYETYPTLPEYLYNEAVFDDVNYVLNKEVLCNYSRAVILNTLNKGKTTSFDDAYAWWDKSRFFESVALDSYVVPTKSINYVSDDFFLAKAKVNLKNNILPLIKNNPDVEFYVFFPPYNVLYWYNKVQKNHIDATITELNYVTEQLLEYKNVKLFYFQNIEGIVDNLYLYKDYIHHNAQINHYMTQCFANGEHLLTKDNYKLEFEKMRSLVNNFDYDLFWGDKIALKKESNLVRYLELLNNPNYISFISVKDEASTNLNESVARTLNNLGFQQDLRNKYRYSYLGIRNGANVTYEKLSPESLNYVAELDGHILDLTSQGADVGNLSSIKIDGIEYSVNSRGLNIVVYDKELRRVVDSVCFDTYDQSQAKRQFA